MYMFYFHKICFVYSLNCSLYHFLFKISNPTKYFSSRKNAMIRHPFVQLANYLTPDSLSLYNYHVLNFPKTVIIHITIKSNFARQQMIMYNNNSYLQWKVAPCVLSEFKKINSTSKVFLVNGVVQISEYGTYVFYLHQNCD